VFEKSGGERKVEEREARRRERGVREKWSREKSGEISGVQVKRRERCSRKVEEREKWRREIRGGERGVRGKREERVVEESGGGLLLLSKQLTKQRVPRWLVWCGRHDNTFEHRVNKDCRHHSSFP
jgi:hypothetical protein